MGTPAGFLNFQGANALENAKQHINVFFTYNKSEGLYFGDDSGKKATADVTPCSYQGIELHGFPISQNCTCNDCELACNPNEGFQYYEPSVFEGFNAPLVAGFYGFTIIVTGAITYYRFRTGKNKEE